MLLSCHTYYSFCYGTLSIDELLNEVEQKGYDRFVLSDINNTSACISTIRLAHSRNIKAIAGIDFRNGVEQKYIGIAINNTGFKELNKHLTTHLHAAKSFDPIAPEFSDAYVIYPLSAYIGQALRENEFIGVSVKDLQRLPFSPARQRSSKLVALQPVTFLGKKHFNAHRLLRAIDKNTLLSKLPATEQTTTDEVMLHKQELYVAYALCPVIIKNTEHILNNCTIQFEYGKLANKNLKQYEGSAKNDRELLRSECIKGLPYRYGKPSSRVMERMEKELEVITQMNFASYFLIN